MTPEDDYQSRPQPPATKSLAWTVRPWRVAICAALLLIGALVVLFAVRMEPRRKAARTLRQAGYDISYGSRQSFLGHYGRKVLGAEVFEAYFEHLSDVASVSVCCFSFDGGCRISHCDQLLLFPENEELFVQSDEIPDALFHAVSGLPNVRTIYLNGAGEFHAQDITGDAMRQLARAKTLESVELRDLVIKDDDLANLADLPNLRDLSLVNVPISGSAFTLTRWKSADRLHSMSIENCPEFGLGGVYGLQQFVRLTGLSLDACPKVLQDLLDRFTSENSSSLFDSPPIFENLKTVSIKYDYGVRGDRDFLSVFGEDERTLLFLDAQPAIQEVFGLPRELLSPHTGRRYTNRWGK